MSCREVRSKQRQEEEEVLSRGEYVVSECLRAGDLCREWCEQYQEVRVREEGHCLPQRSYFRMRFIRLPLTHQFISCRLQGGKTESARRRNLSIRVGFFFFKQRKHSTDCNKCHEDG